MLVTKFRFCTTAFPTLPPFVSPATFLFDRNVLGSGFFFLFVCGLGFRYIIIVNVCDSCETNYCCIVAWLRVNELYFKMTSIYPSMKIAITQK